MRVNYKTQIVNDCPKLAGLLNEDTMSVDMAPVEINAGNIEIRRCLTHLKINDQPFRPDQLLMDKVENKVVNPPLTKYDLFYELFVKATNIMAVNSNYFTGLSMHYAITNDFQKIRLIYQPVVMINPNGSGSEREYDVIRSDEYFEYNTGTKEFKAATNRILDTANYETKVTIIHDENVMQHTRINSSDAKSAIFIFQEIFSVLYANEGNTLSIYNAVPLDASKKAWHTLLLAPEDVNPVKQPILRGVYANLAHLCPPHCDKVKVTVE